MKRCILAFLFSAASFPPAASAQGYYAPSDPYNDRVNAESLHQEQDHEYQQQQYEQQRQADELSQRQYEENRQDQVQYEQKIQQDQWMNEIQRRNCRVGQIC